jgi:hypothetical protein
VCSRSTAANNSREPRAVRRWLTIHALALACTISVGLWSRRPPAAKPSAG